MTRRGLLAVLVLVALAAAGGWTLARDDDPVLRPGTTTAALRTPERDPQAVRIGPWRHRADPQDVGLRAGWWRSPPRMRSVAVPGAAERRVIGGPLGRRVYSGSVGWWRAALVAPTAGRHAVRFGSVGHRATVWVDGRRACSHTGAYEPFDCRVELRRPGRHSVMLRADWRDPERQARDGHDRAWFTWGGPAWSITARRLTDVELRLVGVRTRIERGRARVRLTVELHDTRRTLDLPGEPTDHRQVSGTLVHGGRTIPIAFPDVALPRGARRRTRATVEIADPALWAPGSPALHELELTARDAAPVRRRIGLRDLRRRGTRLVLNGRPLRLVGAGLPPDARGHGDSLTPNDRRRIIEELRALGANTVRTQLPLSDEMLDALDAAGIFVWQLVGPFDKAGRFWARTPQRRARARARALATVDREAAHPSIVAWTMTNELAGQGHPDGQAAYLDALARTLQDRTPGILVAADIWGAHPPRFAGPAFAHLDAVGVTEYIGIAELAGAPPARQDARVRQRLGRLRHVLPDKAIVITEFGANANSRNPAGMPGSLGYQAALLGRRIALYGARPDVAGMLVWTLRDYAVSADFAGGSLSGRVAGLRLSGPLSEKGLFRYDGTPKPAVATVRRAFAAAAR
jgi:hypothetical protein